MLRAISGSTRTVLAGFVASLAILGASLALNSAAEEESAPLRAPAAVPTRVPFNQAESDAMRLAVLNVRFHSLTSRGSGARAFVPFPATLQPLAGYHDLQVGSTFRERDRHYSFDYRVQSIEEDGIVIAYSGSQGGPGAYQGAVSGQVWLKWRFRPTPPRFRKSRGKGTPTKGLASST